ncbi:MAG: acetylornithine/succinylornithine family transaminase [Christensenellales bacterium]|jgi:acetylornithine/N-succinyldiaminopimelate aminotransferase
MDSSSVKQTTQAYVAHTYDRFDLALKSGSGVILEDFEGGTYIDFTCGIGVNALGYAHPDWTRAVAEQAAALSHVSNLYYTAPMASLAQKLCEKSGMKKVFFCNDGGSANEGAVKTARKYSYDKYGQGRSHILVLENSFHGRTVLTLEATGQQAMHKSCFAPYTGGFDYVTANDINDLNRKLTDSTCAVMFELVQGEGGVVPLEKAFVEAIADICREKDILMVIDEVQTGIGRTGSLFCYQQFDLVPDIVTSAKAIGGGLPLGAVLFGEKTEYTLGPGDHATTFGANPIACAGGNVVMDHMTEAFFADVRAKSAHIVRRVSAMPHVKAVHGMGLMLGVTFEDDVSAADILKACMQKGALFLLAKTRLRMLPPLVIGMGEIDAGLDILENVLSDWGRSE